MKSADMHCVVVVILLDTGHSAYYGPITIDGARMNIMNNSKEELKDSHRQKSIRSFITHNYQYCSI